MNPSKVNAPKIIRIVIIKYKVRPLADVCDLCPIGSGGIGGCV